MADNLSPEQRRKTMKAVKGRDRSIELLIDRRLTAFRLRYKRNDPDLPGKPDFVFRRRRAVVFVDGDFWHGWRFPVWSHKLDDYWQKKIARNRARDAANFRKLRRAGWRVLRIWGHQIDRDLDGVVARITSFVRGDTMTHRGSE